MLMVFVTIFYFSYIVTIRKSSNPISKGLGQGGLRHQR